MHDWRSQLYVAFVTAVLSGDVLAADIRVCALERTPVSDAVGTTLGSRAGAVLA
jgi:hypothetical protein